ncbi:amidase [Patulibacter brassicae]|uniref:Amidase n=2 Tax=Patulibacter brassicae TaxID=1705717 RepID=A0ABU4VNC0_9ACTN|nr:amidase [Patulibacter brassicae]
MHDHHSSDADDGATTTVERAAAAAPASGHSRRGFLGRAGVATVAGTAIGSAAGVTLPAAAGAAAPQLVPKARTRARTPRAADAPPLPSAASVKALNKPLVDHDVVELAALLQEGEITSVALTNAYLDRIDRFNGPFEVYGDNGGTNTFVRVHRDDALAQAAEADRWLADARAGGAPAPYLCGIPIGVKDSVGVAGHPAKNGSAAFAGNIAVENATAVQRLRDQGVVILGHTICSAFSGVIAGNFAGNGWNKDYIPGGSSQGSGAAPINRLAAAAIGEETGGSIIWPAAINGASAIKPSLGLGSVAGVMPLSATYDVLGPLCRSGRDAALIMNALVGPDPLNDPQTTAAPIPFPQLPMTPREGSKPLTGLTIGIPQTDWLTRTTYKQDGSTDTTTVVKESPQSLYDPDHKAAFDRLRGELEALGATVKEIRGLDITNYGTAPDYLDGENPYYNNPAVLETIDGTPVTPRNAVVLSNRTEIRYVEAVKEFAATQPADVQATLTTQYGRVPGGASSGTRTLDASIALNAGVTAKARYEGERRRHALVDGYQKSLDDEGVDFLLVLSIGQEVGKRSPSNASGGLPLRRYNQIANDLSWPMVSFPVGQTSNVGLPISAQFWGPRFSEPRLVQAMIDYQAHHPEHHTRLPADPPTPTTTGLRDLLRRQAPETEVDPTMTNDPVVTELDALSKR